jgi:cellulose synthase/poly-beta-1,6-N-acetylglucosamine synthase-like glycosyltransferase
MAFLQMSIIFTGIVGSLMIEASLFSTMRLPKRTKVRVVIKRSYLDQYAILFVLLVGAFLLVYFVTTILNLKNDSAVTAYLALNLSTILFFRYYVAYFIYETKTPMWAKAIRFQHPTQYNNNMSLSFLLPAYNEEKHISRCIESIDKAAAKYPGKTEIIVINDGSTDNTRSIASEAVLNLKSASGIVFNIPNSGKGFALQYGLKRITGDVVFRIDTDSAITEYAIARVMNHFKDSLVGSVSGLILPLEEKSWIQKIWNIHYALITFYKRGWELTDSFLVQPGAFSVFRKDALLKVGGWADDILGEDSDIVVRLARAGYKNEYEQYAIALSDIPDNLKDLREQRLRWSMAFYQARATNLDAIKEFNGPLSVMFMLSILEHGLQYASALFTPFLIAEVIVGHNSINSLIAILGISVGLLTIELVTFGLQSLVNVYFLFKFKKPYIVKYIPMMRLYYLIYGMFIEPESMEILLSVSSKWKRHNEKLTGALRKRAKEEI